jgi:FMN-dependent NADH-azoreductase
MSPLRTTEQIGNPVPLFRLDASIFPDQSVSRELADIVEAEWTAAHPDEQVIRRHIGTSPLPSTAWAEAVVGQQFPQDARGPAQQAAVELATTLADELIAADTFLFAVPLYNYGVSQHIKTWFDILYTDPRINEGGAELRGRPALLVTVSGGNYGPGSPKEGGTTPPPGCTAFSLTSLGSTSQSSTVGSPWSASTRPSTSSRTWPTRCASRQCAQPRSRAASLLSQAPARRPKSKESTEREQGARFRRWRYWSWRFVHHSRVHQCLSRCRVVAAVAGARERVTSRRVAEEAVPHAG